MAKNTATDMCSFVCDQAVQIHGGYGYMREYPVERLFRDARLYPIGGGTRGKGGSDDAVDVAADAECVVAGLALELAVPALGGQVVEGLVEGEDADAARLAMRFEVSEQAMTLRLVKLGYIEPD